MSVRYARNCYVEQRQLKTVCKVGPKRHILFQIENKVIDFSEFENFFSGFEQKWDLFFAPMTIVKCWKSLVQNPGFCKSDN
jgi:hypothetical protein